MLILGWSCVASAAVLLGAGAVGVWADRGHWTDEEAEGRSRRGWQDWRTDLLLGAVLMTAGIIRLATL